jgi:hypothetical protein
MDVRSRFERWVKASFVTARYEHFMPATVQGLGRIDQILYVEDQRLVSEPLESAEPSDLTLHITLSHLWVLGAYEVLRTIHQRCREGGGVDESVRDVLRRFERLRIPLAKFEPAGRHKETDTKIAYPALNAQYGVAWQVAEDVFIPRGELSDEFLMLLEGKRQENVGEDGGANAA